MSKTNPTNKGKRTSKKTTAGRRSPRSKSPADETATGDTTTPVVAPESGPAGSEAKGKRRRSPGRGAGAAARARGKGGRVTSAKKAGAIGEDVQTKTVEASVVEAPEGIVIRFPAVAPPPFAPLPKQEMKDRPAGKPAPRFEPPVSRVEPPARRHEPPPVSRFEPEVGQEEVPPAERPWASAAVEGVEALGVAPVKEVKEPRRGAADEHGEKISASKKRRMRRRRRQSNREGQAPPAEPPAAPKPEAVLFEPPDQAAEQVAEDREDPTPWLQAAEAIKAGLATPTIEEEPLPQSPAEAQPTEALPAEPVPAAPARPVPAEGGPRERDRGRRRGRRGRRSSRRDGGEDRNRGAIEVAPDEEAEAVEVKPSAGGPVREMVINAIPREECRIGILASGRLEEIYIERATAENHVGNIYKGVVTNVEPSIQAAFVDFGQGKNGFLHISDLHPQYFPDGAGQTENVGHKTPRRSRPPIQRCLRRGQELIVQVTKEGIGTKGPTLSTYLSIPGRFLVMMPGMGRLGVSRRIEDDDCRDKLRSVLGELELPEGMGFIARTAAMDRTKRELQGDLTYLTRLWRAVDNRMRSEPAPAELYRESDLVIRTIRDVFTNDIQRIVVDDPDVAERAKDFLSIFSPKSADIVSVFSEAVPIFHRYGIEAELERLHSRRVPLNSGGSLVIESTEALVAIDVNSGRFRTEDDAEATAYKINLEAADEIARQLRLRDLGGVIVCDFIDMRMESHRRDIERRVARNLKEHKERAKVLRMSEFGIIELTRQRQRASITRSVYQDCRHCRGTGLVKTVESVSLDVMRLIQLAVTKNNIHTIEVVVSPDVAYLLQNRKRRLLYELESKNRRVISMRPEPAFGLDQVEIRCADARGRLVPNA